MAATWMWNAELPYEIKMVEEVEDTGARVNNALRRDPQEQTYYLFICLFSNLIIHLVIEIFAYLLIRCLAYLYT